ncbi:MAG: diadenylate cyclase CdaA [Anaerovoracaceae bacterium]|jgi:diadenylate cyclase
MNEFFGNLMSGVAVTDILDIAIVAYATYKVLGFIKQTRAEQLVRGLLILVLVMIVAGLLHLYATYWILRSTLAVGAIALVIVFQPELRRGLEHMGRSKFLNPGMRQLEKKEARNFINQFLRGIEEGSASRTGMLLVIEREISLEDIVETGTVVDAAVTAELLGNIFYEGAPLHDGAVVIRGTRVYAAGCVLPLTENKSLPTELGTRHRAGIGITEKSDALTVIVSEETGIISMAQEGHLERYLERKNVEKALLDIYLKNEKQPFFGHRSRHGGEGERDDV